MQQGLESSEEREARPARRRLTINGMLRDSESAQYTERLACESSNQRGLSVSIK